jgi:sec-independent protein translocase protein TatA
MFFFISGTELVFIFFIVLLVFGADKIPSIAKTLAKGVTQVRNATNEIKSEIQKSVDSNDPVGGVGKDIKKQVDKVKDDFNELTDSIKRDL